MNLLEPFTVNAKLTLKNRIVMAPMTRVSATPNFVPTSAMAEYYAKRAAAGLIITEGTIIAADARGHNQVPGIFTEEQMAGWKKVTDAVHQQDGKIFQQIWHVGRVSHPSFLNNALPLSASATLMQGRINRAEGLHYGAARAATTAEMTALIAQYKRAAENAMTAGFDGVEIHGANGYLIDQFLHYHTNLRNDEFGGTPQKMAAFPLAVVKAVGDAIGYEKLGLRLSPGAYLNEIQTDLRDGAVFQYLLSALNTLSLAYVHTGNFNDSVKFAELNDDTMSHFIRTHYQGNVIGCGSYSPESASLAIENNQFDLIAFGRPFIANPDLIQKLRQNLPLTAYDASMLATLN